MIIQSRYAELEQGVESRPQREMGKKAKTANSFDAVGVTIISITTIAEHKARQLKATVFNFFCTSSSTFTSHPPCCALLRSPFSSCVHPFYVLALFVLAHVRWGVLSDIVFLLQEFFPFLLLIHARSNWMGTKGWDLGVRTFCNFMNATFSPLMRLLMSMPTSTNNVVIVVTTVDAANRAVIVSIASFLSVFPLAVVCASWS